MGRDATAMAGGLQTLVGAALTDPDVLDQLLHNPLELVKRFDVSVRERRFLASIRPSSLEHFAALVEDWMDGVALVESSLSGPARVKLAG